MSDEEVRRNSFKIAIIGAGSDKGYGICSINGTGTCCGGIDKNDE